MPGLQSYSLPTILERLFTREPQLPSRLSLEQSSSGLTTREKKDWCITKKFFIQVNIGNEKQKSGIEPKLTKQFYQFCIEKSLNIVGLMCIPPNDVNPEFYFKEMVNIKKTIADDLILSMGMSQDYLMAINHGSNMIRVGSAIFK